MSDDCLLHFVGAGSGAADLITVRGAKLLAQADVVVWAGSLVNGELLSYCKATCEIYDSATMTLEETDAVLQRAVRAGKRCVRLHTGDPALYGAIREQTERLGAAGIRYEVVPGVSSMFAAAAALKRELTVPGVTQTVIVSRMEGRTPVPCRERLRLLASHGATMVLFLSVGALPALVTELLAGGAYTNATPCAVVYKASWHDERIVRAPLSDIAEKVAAAGITKTALVLVGDFLGERYELSRLYDKHFSTEYRKGDNADVGTPPAATRQKPAEAGACVPLQQALARFARVAVVCFSEQGASLAARLSLAVDASVLRCFGSEHPPLHDFCAEQFARAQGGEATLVVFIGAAGIAVRSIAPFIKSKQYDPAVVCLDDSAHFAIPLLSGHLGGANAAACALAAAFGATSVITTATDARGAWAVDSWASAHNVALPDLVTAKRISAAVLAGRRVFALGVGCKRGTDFLALRDFVHETLTRAALPPSLIGAVVSLERKKDERAIRLLSDTLFAPFVTYSAAELLHADAGSAGFSASAFVYETTGVDCVCERAAVLAAHTTADWLLVRKTARNGMTLSLAVGAELL